MTDSDLSFDAQLLLRFLAKNCDAKSDELIIQLMPNAALDLIVDQTTPGDKDWPKEVNDLLQYYVDDAQKRARVALDELVERGFISKTEREKNEHS